MSRPAAPAAGASRGLAVARAVWRRLRVKFVALSVVARAARGDGPDARAGRLTNHTTRRVGPRRRFAPYTQLTHKHWRRARGTASRE